MGLREPGSRLVETQIDLLGADLAASEIVIQTRAEDVANVAVEAAVSGGVATDSGAINAFTYSEAWIVAMIAPYSLAAGTSGVVYLTANMTFEESPEPNRPTGTFDAFGKWQWRVPAGTWADVQPEIRSGTGYEVFADAEHGFYYANEPGTLAVAQTAGGLTPATTYEFQLLLRNDDHEKPLAFTGTGRALTDDPGAAPGASDGELELSIINLSSAMTTKPLFRFRMSEGMTFTGGAADSEVAATATAVFPIHKDGAQIGTVTFSAAGTTGAIAFTDGVFPDGSLFELFPPASADATLDQVSITLT